MPSASPLEFRSLRSTSVAVVLAQRPKVLQRLMAGTCFPSRVRCTLRRKVLLLRMCPALNDTLSALSIASPLLNLGASCSGPLLLFLRRYLRFSRDLGGLGDRNLFPFQGHVHSEEQGLCVLVLWGASKALTCTCTLHEQRTRAWRRDLEEKSTKCVTTVTCRSCRTSQTHIQAPGSLARFLK